MNHPVIPTVPSAYLHRAPTVDADTVQLDLDVDGNSERASVLLQSDGTCTMKARVLVRGGTK